MREKLFAEGRRGWWLRREVVVVEGVVNKERVEVR